MSVRTFTSLDVNVRTDTKSLKITLGGVQEVCVKPNLCLRYTLPDGDIRTTILPDRCSDEISIREYMRYRPSMARVTKYEVIPVACQNCWECRLAYARTWANRCVMESALYDSGKCWFVTLTYDEEHIQPLLLDPGAFTDTYTGEYFEFFDVFGVDDDGVEYQRTTFDKSYLVKFMKDLRRQWEYHHNHVGIRFFQSSEYGDKRERAHHHFLLFNCPLFDLDPLYRNKFGDQLYLSEELSKVWGRGIVVVGEFNWNTAAYTARYVMKKLKGPLSYWVYENDRGGQLAPFSTMSRNPGIAGAYFDGSLQNGLYTIECINDDGVPIFRDKIVLPSNGGKSNIVTAPRYFDERLKEINPEHYEMLKDARRRLVDTASKTRQKLTNLSCRDLLEARELSLAAKKTGLHRALQEIF